MKILLITQWFDPEPAFKGLPFAKALAGLGHEVEVLTGFPNYPGGKIYEGYSVRVLQREVVDGIRVIRVPLYPSHDRSAVGRVANYASFALSSGIIGPLLTRRADVAYVYHPPATVGLAALTHQLLKRVPFIYDIQDLWPDTLAASGMVSDRGILALVGWWCRAIYARADRIVVLSPGFKTKLVERGVTERKIEVIYNWCSEEQQLATPAPIPDLIERYRAGNVFNIVYTGNMGRAQGLEAVLDAAELLKSATPRIQFIFVGAGLEAERLKDRAQSMALPNVFLVPRQPASEIGRYVAVADALLVHLRRDPLFKITIPSKTQAALAAGKPILIGVEGDAADLVERAGAGVACEPENPRSIADGALKLASLPKSVLLDMGKRGRAFYMRELSMSIGVARFEALMRSLCTDADEGVASGIGGH